MTFGYQMLGEAQDLPSIINSLKGYKNFVGKNSAECVGMSIRI